MKDLEHTHPPVIHIRDLHKSFGSLDILKGVNLDVYTGENMVVLGRSGAGKSVLIKMIVGLLKQDSGVLQVFGKDINKLHGRELDEVRLRIGFSFQNAALYDSMSVRENLEFPLKTNRKNMTKKERMQAVEEVLDSVGLIKWIDQMPSELSGGQRKRIGIARTLILKPEVMLYDEPTAGLDPITSGEINALINQVQEQYHTTSIIITHDLVCASDTADRVTMLLNGKFVQTGTFEEVFSAQDEQVQNFYNYNFISKRP